MTRELLISLIPCTIALFISGLLIVAIWSRLGIRFDWSRLGDLHRNEVGAVQTLSFVITIPVLVMLVLFVLQVSQLMVAQMVVHYAASAAVRAAVVWIPANVPDSLEDPNVLLGSIQQSGNSLWIGPTPESVSIKYQAIHRAAALACMPISPSQDLQASNLAAPWVLATHRTTEMLYGQLVPSSRSNSRISPRLFNKLAYSDQNTTVYVEWQEVPHPGKDVEVSPTYNPRGHLDPSIVWNPNEVGWRDPVTVHVVHRYALLPGPGRLLSHFLLPPGGGPDRVAPRIETIKGLYREPVYITTISATATLVNEGIKSRYNLTHDL